MNSRLLLLSALIALSSIVINAQTTDPHTAIKRGNELVAKEKYESAIEEYEKVSSSAEEPYSQALYNIGVCHYQLWRTEESIVFFRRAIQLRKGRYPKAWYALGTALEDQGTLREAKDAYNQALETSHGEFVLAKYNLGLLASKEGDFKGAAILFKEATARPGRHVPASHNNLGVMLARMGLLIDAEKEFAIALAKAEGKFDDAAHNLELCRSLLASIAANRLDELRLQTWQPSGRLTL